MSQSENSAAKKMFSATCFLSVLDCGMLTAQMRGEMKSQLLPRVPHGAVTDFVSDCQNGDDLATYALDDATSVAVDSDCGDSESDGLVPHSGAFQSSQEQRGFGFGYGYGFGFGGYALGSAILVAIRGHDHESL